uniref:Orc2_1 protein n=1 Tax=Fopius arisanus TaxID=64838 RepID=A0A0C9QID2_9HYME
MAIYGGRLMYQFIVGITTPRITRMAMTSGTNKWASRVVVILQLAAWSAVGIVLLQKGVTSLQKKPPDSNNVTQTTTLSSSNFHGHSGLAVIPIIEENPHSQESRKNVDKSPWKVPLEPEDEPRVLESIESPKDEESTKKPQRISKKPPKWSEIDLFPIPTPRYSLPEPERHPDKTEEMITDKVPASSTPPATTKSGMWESRRRVRLSHLSGGGAAAAVAMVAVGAVMLVLGPAVIVLRALDERRQERRFLKLSGRDDLPPTYEQATLMDEAPRYSSLSLNTILGPPPPPSPTPARVHLV